MMCMIETTDFQWPVCSPTTAKWGRWMLWTSGGEHCALGSLQSLLPSLHPTLLYYLRPLSYFIFNLMLWPLYYSFQLPKIRYFSFFILYCVLNTVTYRSSLALLQTGVTPSNFRRFTSLHCGLVWSVTPPRHNHLKTPNLGSSCALLA